MDESKSNSASSIIATIITAVAAIATIWLQILYAPQQSPEQKQISIILFAAILVVLLIFFLGIWIWGKFKKIDENEQEIMKIKKIIDTEKRFGQITERLAGIDAILHSGKLFKNKKGDSNAQIWLAILILIFLFYFYLKALGIIK